MADGQVIFEIQADGSRAIAGVRDVTRNIEQETQRWDRAAGNSAGNMEQSMISSVKNIASAIGAAKIGKMILEWGKAAIDAASDLSEVQNVVDVTFGDSANKIESWAKAAGASFGLTETQAKKFTSTLGAMMKSAGLSGNEIVDMSTDLAGLASDMASFYNLDFETAFQKIRAGISGETEPLKQLGVNMSVANLEAFALEKGITKAFNAMSQSEQVMLRYQYLMSATADAQGDFARTSDGFANASRRIETAVESIKTNIGNLLLPAVETATSYVADFLGKLTAPPEETVFDKVNKIEVDTKQKLKDIETVADKADGLIEKLGIIQGTDAGEAIGKMAEGANKLNASSPQTWSSVLSALQGVDGLQNIFKNTQAATNVSSLANALSNSTVDESKASAWKRFLGTLSENAGALAAYTGESESDVRTWLGDMAQKAKELDPSDVTAWDALFTDLTKKLGISAEDVERITGIKDGANGLLSNSVTNWQGLFGVLSDVNGLENIFSNSQAATNVQSLADALSNSTVDETKANAWKSFLGTLSENAGALAQYTGQSETDVRTWLAEMAEKAKGLDPSDVTAWDSLFNDLTKKLGITAEDVERFTGIKDSANGLLANSVTNWQGLLGILQGVDGLQNVFSNSQAAANITSLADALSNSTVDSTKAEAWKSFLGTLSENAGALSAYTGESETDIRTWLGEMAAKAKELDPSDVTAWDSLFEDLTKKLGITAEDVERVTGIKDGANALKTNSVQNWKTLFAVLADVNGLGNVFGAQSNASGNIQSLADALSGASIDTNKAEAWKTLLGALSDNADAVSKLTGKNAEETKKWLDGISESVNKIDVNDANAWDSLLTTLVSGFTGTPEGQQFIEGLAGQFLAMGQDSEEAVKGLTALGFTSGQIEEKQSEWLKTCKQLVQTIPGLSEVINTETGEIKGGIGALDKYVDEWKNSQEKLLLWKAYYAKKTALAESQGSIYTLQVEAIGKNWGLARAKKAYEDLLTKYGIDPNDNYYGLGFNGFSGAEALTYGIGISGLQELNGALRDYKAKAAEAEDATRKYNTAVEQNASVTETLQDEYEGLTELYGAMEEAETGAGEAVQDFGGKTADAWKTATSGAQTAIKALADYVKTVHDATESAVNSVISGFDSAKMAGDDLRKKSSELAKEEADVMQKYGKTLAKYTDKSTGVVDLERIRKNWEGVSPEVREAYNALVAVKNKQTELNEEMEKFQPKGMKAALQSQLEFMEQYTADLAKAREMGLSDELLASLSDGSAESAEYLHALLTDPTTAKEIDALYKEVQEKKDGFTDTLTKQKLTVDETYQGMVDAAKKAIDEMKLGDEAASASGETVSGLATGIKSHVEEVADAVDAVCTELDRLSDWGISVNIGDFGSINFGTSANNPTPSGEHLEITPHETGLDYVPYTGYLASLHAGEGILTAEENRIWQRFKNGGTASQNVDYDALGGVMRDNINPGGDVYLDGRVVGAVISAQQGRSFRNLQRSGWQG